MTRISIAQLMKLNPKSNITMLRIWNGDEVVFGGMMDKCPKEHLHKPIAEWMAGEWELIVHF